MTYQSAGGVSGSHGGVPRLPPTRQECPNPSISAPAIDEVVLLPLVPVTASTRPSGASASQRPRPPTNSTPAVRSAPAGASYGLIPGLLMTTSQRDSASAPPRSSASTAVPSGATPSVRSTTAAGSMPSAASRRKVARPSTPTPQTPTRRPGS